MSKEETIKLIEGRINDEFKKHPDLNWSLISAQKIYSQWNEYYVNEINDLKERIQTLTINMEHYKRIANERNAF